MAAWCTRGVVAVSVTLTASGAAPACPVSWSNSYSRLPPGWMGSAPSASAARGVSSGGSSSYCTSMRRTASAAVAASSATTAATRSPTKRGVSVNRHSSSGHESWPGMMR